MAATESYDEIKNKTLQWCQKLLDNKIYDQDKYNKCVGSFIDLGVGQLPNDMAIPEKGNEFEYGLYNHKTGSTTQGIIPSDINNKIMLSTTNNLYLNTDENGLLTSSSSDTVIDQETIQWSLIKKSDTQYSFLSKYGKFIGCEDNGRVSANRQEIRNSCIWNISSVNSYITIESVQYPGQYLTADTSIHLALNSGESQKWIITIVPKPDEAYIVPYDITPIKVKKINKLDSIVELYKQRYKLHAELALIDKLIFTTSNIYDNTIINVNKNIKQINDDYNKLIIDLKRKYSNPGDTITSLSTAERTLLANYTDESSIINLKPDVIKKSKICTSRVCDYNQITLIKDSKIARISLLSSLKDDINTKIMEVNSKIDIVIRDLDNISADLDAKLSNNTRLINNNNIELSRQAGFIDQIQRDNLALDANKKKLEVAAEQAVINQNISSSYNTSNTYNSYIYYTVISIVVLMCCLMIYSFIKKLVYM
jgi:hypothetical protein